MKIAIISGKGGSGKSSITAAFVALSPKVVAIDCDVDASNLPLLFSYTPCEKEQFVSGHQLLIDASKCIGCGICQDSCAFHAINILDGTAVVNPFFCEDCRLCEKLCPTQSITLAAEAQSTIYKSHFSHGILIHGHLHPGDDNSGKMIARLREIADETMQKEGIKLQLLDGPPGIGCPVLSTITGIDKVVIVAEPTRSGLSDLKRACQVSQSFCKDLHVIINKCDINTKCKEEIVNVCHQMDIPILAQIPFDKQLVDAQVQGESIVDHAPESIVSRTLVDAYHTLIK